MLDEVLRELPGNTVRAVVVWEPVLGTDIAAPTSSVLALVPGSYVAQFWDPDLSLSRDIVRAVAKDPVRYGFDQELPDDYIVWDVVAVFGADASWSEDLPVPSYYGGPIYSVKSAFREAIEHEIERRSSPN